MALRNPNTRRYLIHLLVALGDPAYQQRVWVEGRSRSGRSVWADEFNDDLNDGYMAVENVHGVDPHDAIGDTLLDASEADILVPLFERLDAVRGVDRKLPSREGAVAALAHPGWPDVVRAARAARAVITDQIDMD